MPIYKQADYNEVITRIRKKIALLDIKMGEVLSENEIAAFEAQHQIKLPASFRIFLKEIGDGCEEMVDGFPLNQLKDMTANDLSSPFLLKEAWVWEDDDSMSWEELEEAMETRLKGELELIDIGCGMSYNLIVTGDCRGEVWNFTDVGVQPCCEQQDFLGWFELWLDMQEDVDYFKDYVY